MRYILGAALAAAAFAASPTYAADIVTDCSAIGLDDIIPNADACVGYYDKNALKSSAGGFASDDEVAALGLLGLTGDIKVLEKINGSGDFVQLLNGITYIGVHYGRGNGPVDVPGGVTAFYRFDAGVNLDEITFTPGSISSVSLYSTGPAVPEPATWAMMIGGFGLLGAAARRRRTTIAYA